MKMRNLCLATMLGILSLASMQTMFAPAITPNTSELTTLQRLRMQTAHIGNIAKDRAKKASEFRQRHQKKVLIGGTVTVSAYVLAAAIRAYLAVGLGDRDAFLKEWMSIPAQDIASFKAALNWIKNYDYRTAANMLYEGLQKRGSALGESISQRYQGARERVGGYFSSPQTSGMPAEMAPSTTVNLPPPPVSTE